MEKIGEILRKRRLEKELSFDEIEKSTKIRRRYLEALENEEWDIFPGTVYLKGFLKTYCRYLDLNETGYIAVLEEQLTPRPSAEPLPEKIELPGRPRRKIAVILGIIAIIILLSSQFVYNKYFNQPLTVVNTPPAAPGDNNPALPSEPPFSGTTGQIEEPQEEEGSPPETTSLTLRIKVIDYKCWVIVKDGNEQVYEGILNKGEEKTFAGLSQVYFGLGNSGDVEVYLNDRYLGVLGTKGEVVYKRFAFEDNEIKEINLGASPNKTSTAASDTASGAE